MILTLYRFPPGEDGTFGVICKNNIPICTTKEPVQSIIPKGIYRLDRYASPKFGRDVLLFQHVEGHEYVEIHVGNYLKDTEGCILAGLGFGYSRGEQIVTNSRKALDMLLEDYPHGFVLEIKDFSTGLSFWQRLKGGFNV